MEVEASSSPRTELSSSTNCCLLDIPSACIRDVAKFLPASSLIRFLSTCRSVHAQGDASAFWIFLQAEQSCVASSEVDAAAAAAATLKQAKQSYLLQSQINPQVSSVQWHRVDGDSCPSGREGHLGCRLLDSDTLLLTGGFTDDGAVYYKHFQEPQGPWRAVNPLVRRGTVEPTWVYGATLTALDDHRAVRFGGFASGGYTSAVAEVAVLHFTVDPQTSVGHAAWEVVTCHSASTGQAIRHQDPRWTELAGRAYHSTVLLFQRYLLVVGGMQETGSILSPMLLDTHTWTWYTDNITLPDADAGEPSGRHGSSLVSDLEENGRLLLFGGGSGSDLLRSGRDTADVWELRLPPCTAATLLQSLPWEWHRVMEEPTPDITATDRLTLGRCHVSTRVSRNTILFAFGSGTPSCNGLLGFRTDTNTFFRLTHETHIHGSLPCCRFTCAAMYVEEMGYWIFHGGYSTRRQTIQDMCVLDVAAALRRPFTVLRLEPLPISYPAVVAEPSSFHHPGGMGNVEYETIAAIIRRLRGNRHVDADILADDDI